MKSIFIICMLMTSSQVFATDESNVKVTQIKNTNIKDGMNSVAEKWLDSETGVVCYVVKKGGSDASATISCVNYK